jgi:hypothetical protein
VTAATPQTGPVIKAFGPVFEVPAGSYHLVPSTPYKISMDISSKGLNPAATNRSLASAARFLNRQGSPNTTLLTALGAEACLSTFADRPPATWVSHHQKTSHCG